MLFAFFFPYMRKSGCLTADQRHQRQEKLGKSQNFAGCQNARSFPSNVDSRCFYHVYTLAHMLPHPVWRNLLRESKSVDSKSSSQILSV